MKNVWLALALVLIGTNPLHVAANTLPDTVSVLPVFFVPVGEQTPTEAQKTKLMQHLSWSKQRFLEMLKFRDTFAFATTTPMVYNARHSLTFYKSTPDGGASQYVCELLNVLGYDRTNCPYILVVVIMNPPGTAEYPPGAGARPINGGYNTGGGLFQTSSHYLDQTVNLQSTMQHELGHSFGLPHVDVYGYSMETNASIMSYNPNHLTSHFTASATPGALIPEDFRGLAGNRRAFPGLYFNASDIPANYLIKPVVGFGPMDLETGVSPPEIRQSPFTLTVPFAPRTLIVNDVTQPGDVIVSTHATDRSPPNEAVANAIDDNPNTKHLNFGDGTDTAAPLTGITGFTVTPSAGDTVVTGLALTSANDVPDRDPASYILEGSSDGGALALIAQGPVPAFSGRLVSQTISFANRTPYTSYKLTFPTLVNATAAIAMQIAEVELLGTLPPNADLASLVPSMGTLTPAFASELKSYTLSGAYATSSMTFTPTAAQTNATVKVNGVTVTSGTASSAINLAVGSNSIIVAVTTEDGATSQTYVVTVTRTAASNNADLISLVPSIGLLTPGFHSGTLSYEVEVPNATSAMTVTPTVAQANATVEVNGMPVTSGTASAIALTDGTNSITVDVTAEDGTTVNGYVLNVVRTPGSTGELPPTQNFYRDTVMSDGPVSYWRLDETSGGLAQDSAGANNGTYLNNPTLGLPGALVGTTSTSVGFQSSRTQHVDVAYSAALNPAIFTIELWVKVPNRSVFLRSPLSSQDYTLHGHGYIFYVVDDTWDFWHGWSGTNTWQNVSSQTVQFGVWTYLAATYDGTTMRFYINGVEEASTAIGFTPNTTTPLRMGGQFENGDGIYFFDGSVDEVAVYNKALTAQQIAAHFAARTPSQSLAVQFDSTSLSLPNSSPVGTWGGQTAAGAPTYLNDQTPNGKPAVRFSGSSRMGENVIIPSSVAGDWIVAAVIKPLNIGSYHNLVDDETHGTPMLWIDSSFQYEMNFGGSGARGAGTGPGGWDIVIADSRLNQVYVNSRTPNAAGASAVPLSAGKEYDFFHRDGDQTYQGLVAELRLYTDRAVFGGDFARLYDELYAKWIAVIEDVTRPGDWIVSSHPADRSPATESVTNAIDNNPDTKYLNTGDHIGYFPPQTGITGFTVTPSAGASLVTGLTLTSANDSPERDPASYKLEGSNDGSTFSLIAEGSVPVFSARFSRQEIFFANVRSFTSYRLTFPTVANVATASAMQIAEVELLGTTVGGPIPAEISISQANGGITIHFTGTLESAHQVTGPYLPVTGATSPTLMVTPVGAAKFYRAVKH